MLLSLIESSACACSSLINATSSDSGSAFCNSALIVFDNVLTLRGLAKPRN